MLYIKDNPVVVKNAQRVAAELGYDIVVTETVAKGLGLLENRCKPEQSGFIALQADTGTPERPALVDTEKKTSGFILAHCAANRSYRRD